MEVMMMTMMMMMMTMMMEKRSFVTVDRWRA
jgi:hypothetical protein